MRLQTEEEDRIRRELEYNEKIRIPNWSEGYLNNSLHFLIY